VAVFDSGSHSAGLIHSHVGRFVSCKAFCAGLERITGLGSTDHCDRMSLSRDFSPLD